MLRRGSCLLRHSFFGIVLKTPNGFLSMVCRAILPLKHADALINTYIGWYDLTDKTDVETRTRCLDLALKLKPDHPALIQRCAAFSVITPDAAETGNLENKLNDALANGTAPTIVHIILGTVAARDLEFSKAVVHLEQAQLESPEQPIVNNNLAWVLHQQSQSNTDATLASAGDRDALLDRALGHANMAIEGAPRVPEFLETRGQILADQKNYRESIRDLEAALQLGMNSKEIHNNAGHLPINHLA